ncbi:putative C6 transcription factor [Talaromyces proteolyticus]|uniref:C6 transcription factor n=1 Tax=Talaromyces proteolyticus TaxID=1131652 RepID=A0AAD4PX38_9EURO|nr:putative C6 transcription factor [Talaromyces proteolyticus]KAH8692204.1 putative C6 transcription factor [Talaromyces proteolyticus]
MTPTPPSTSSSVAGHSPEGQYRVIRKRNRVPLSCAPCRQRKLKCNRSHPCENCVKRGDASSCSYAQLGSRKKSSATQSSSNSPDDMQNRIDRLESLVLSLMTNGSQSAGPAAAVAALSGNDSIGSVPNSQDLELDDDVDGQEESETESVTKSFGIMKMDNNKSMYISEAHWASVLNDIAEVRQYFSSHKKQYEEQAQKLKAAKPEIDTSMLLFGSVKAPSKAEIMASFPSRYTTDMLIARYFNTYSPGTRELFTSPIPNILHVPTFQRDYNNHWKDPSASCIIWIGMLFAMMRLAMLSYYRDGDEPPEFRGKALDMARNFRHLMSQCLILGDFTKPYPYLIETLILHLHGDFSQTKEADVAVWIMVGIITRLAMRMGYHRDSKMFPNITPFQGEMRRRVWTFVRQADLLFSFQVGMPSMLRSGDTDTEIPRNLYDEDFDEDSKEIPPSRPNNEPTPVSYLIAKSRLSFTFGRVNEQTSSVRNEPYETVMDIDTELRHARDLIPDHLKVRPIEESQLDPANLVLSRFYIESVYHKAQCVLHRRYIARARENPRFTHSRRTCIDSSMELLRYQAVLHEESRPGGRLQKQIRDNAINNNNYLLAGTIICLDLYHGLQLQAAGRPSGDMYTWGRERRDEMLEAIQRALGIWEEMKDDSMEAWKASGVLRVMLAKLTFKPGPPTTETNTNPPLFETHDEKQNAAMTLGLLSSGMSPQNAGTTAFTDSFKGLDTSLPSAGFAPTPADTLGLTSPFGMFGQVPDMQLDWDAWDSYIGNPANVDNLNPLWPMPDLTQQSPESLNQTPNPPPPGEGTRARRLRLPGILPSDGGATFDPSAPPIFMTGPSSNDPSAHSQQQQQQQQQ